MIKLTVVYDKEHRICWADSIERARKCEGFSPLRIDNLNRESLCGHAYMENHVWICGFPTSDKYIKAIEDTVL